MGLMPFACPTDRDGGYGCLACSGRTFATNEPVLVAVADLLLLRSGESTLLCRAGHVAGHPHFCPGGCDLVEGASSVRDVIAFKEQRDLDLDLPVQVEGGWLIDGHHRVKQALAERRCFLPVTFVRGVLLAQQEYHHSIVLRCMRSEK